MVIMQKNVSLLERFPQFFKIFLPDQSSDRLRIPPQFMGNFNLDLPLTSTVTCCLQRSWQVDLEKVNGNVYLNKGWKRFVNDNQLQFGDFLIFYYDGLSSFYVKIFGKDGCRKYATLPSMDNDTTTVATIIENPRKSVDLVQHVVPEENCEDERSLSLDVSMENEESGGDFEAASRFMSRFPFFKILLRHPCVTRGLLHIPTSFVKTYMGNSRTGRLVFSDRSWSFRLSRPRRNVASFTCGWLQFSRDNKLRAGDMCVFELIDKDKNVLKASIFRCKE